MLPVEGIHNLSASLTSQTLLPSTPHIWVIQKRCPSISLPSCPPFQPVGNPYAWTNATECINPQTALPFSSAARSSKCTYPPLAQCLVVLLMHSVQCIIGTIRLIDILCWLYLGHPAVKSLKLPNALVQHSSTITTLTDISAGHRH